MTEHQPRPAFPSRLDTPYSRLTQQEHHERSERAIEAFMDTYGPHTPMAQRFEHDYIGTFTTIAEFLDHLYEDYLIAARRAVNEDIDPAYITLDHDRIWQTESDAYEILHDGELIHALHANNPTSSLTQARGGYLGTYASFQALVDARPDVVLGPYITAVPDGQQYRFYQHPTDPQTPGSA